MIYIAILNQLVKIFPPRKRVGDGYVNTAWWSRGIRMDDNTTLQETIDRLNETLSSYDDKLIDYVVEQSDNKDPNQGWVWEKRNSGIAACWGWFEFTSKNGWNTINKNFPIKFLTTPTISSAVANGGDAGCYIGHATTTVSGAIVYAYTYVAGNTAWVSVECKGMWK